MRKIIVVISARASLSRFKSALVELNVRSDVELSVVLTGSASESNFGEISGFIDDLGIRIERKLHNMVLASSDLGVLRSCSLALDDLSQLFFSIKPDMVVTIADRAETLMTSVAAAYQGICLVHIQGGEMTGNIDEKVRHANTKLADIHITSTEHAKNVVLQLGEDPSRVFNTGCPSIDLAKEALFTEDIRELSQTLNNLGIGAPIDFSRDYIVVLYHPVTYHSDSARDEVMEILRFVNAHRLQCVWFWPNADAGSQSIMKELRRFRETTGKEVIRFVKNLKGELFIQLLKNAVCLVGNSSAGIRECSYIPTYALNIGDRQRNRIMANNVVNCECDVHSLSEAFNSIRKKPILERSYIYGDGNSAKKIASILATIDLASEKNMNIWRLHP